MPGPGGEALSAGQTKRILARTQRRMILPGPEVQGAPLGKVRTLLDKIYYFAYKFIVPVAISFFSVFW